ncbi:MAG: hypothetical protein JWO38_2325 [Gemmataceae bacterium]|nr:hypothetical protein [Gemmataceae bacterium]
MGYGDFFVTGDEWALVEVVPAENREHYAQLAHRITEHHKDTKFSPLGWTTPPFILPGPNVPLSLRAIRPETITEVFTGILAPTDRVTTCEDFTGPPFPTIGCLAWKVPGGSPFEAGFYGELADGLLTALWWSDRQVDRPTADRIADGLAQIGSRYRLILVAHGMLVIDPEDRERMVTYLTEHTLPE